MQVPTFVCWGDNAYESLALLMKAFSITPALNTHIQFAHVCSLTIGCLQKLFKERPSDFHWFMLILTLPLSNLLTRTLSEYHKYAPMQGH